MKITLSSENIKKVDTALEIRIVLDLEDVCKYDKEILDDLNFKAKDEEVVFLVESKKIYVGCEENSYDAIAIAISAAIKKFNSTKYKDAKIEIFGKESLTLKALVEGAILGSYTFEKYKSKKEKEETEPRNE